jgi:uncharacterized repeat protein (TIGR01451 family)/fimbrial isopeptide formation D2 family protein
MAIFLNAPIATADPSDPVPTVSLAVPSSALIGQQVGFDVSFVNSGPNTGYGPYVDLAMPMGTNLDDGLTFLGATYLGASVTAVQLTADINGNVVHPYAVDSSGAPLVIHGLAAGQSYIVLRLPFGSFTPGQPPAVVHVTAQMSTQANASIGLQITADGGFQFGRTPVNDPATDPTILGGSVTSSVNPTIMLVSKTYNGPESETATGPNYPESYTITVTVAPGQTVHDLVVSDTLPDNLQYLSTNPTTPSSSAVSTPTLGTPGGLLSNDFGSVTGTGGVDARMTVNFYIPRLDASASDVLPHLTGTFSHSINTASATANWPPLDPRDWDGINPVVVSASSGANDLTDKSVAVQKSVRLLTDLGAPGASPGDTLEWTMQIEVSDYFALQNVVVDDNLGDGSIWDGTAPTLSVDGNGFASAAADIDAANYDAAAPNTNGISAFAFRISNELATRSQDNRLVGGCIDPVAGSATPDCTPGYDDGPTTATVTFRSVIQQTYHKTGLEVVEGDTLGNAVTVGGDVLSTTAPFTATGSSVQDGSGASITIQRGVLEKSIYAINGVAPLPGQVHVSPGDSITYELKQAFPTSRTDDFRIIDYLPLPIFSAAELATFDSVFDPDWSTHPTDDLAPAAGTAKYGPGDTFHALDSVDSGKAPTPTISTDGTANSVEFHYGDYALYPPAASVADILFTVTVTDKPFADGLLFTNQARSQTRNAAGTLQTADAIIQIVLDQPVLAITKGVVASSHSGAVFAPETTGPVDFTVPPDNTCPAWTGGSITSAGLASNPINSDLDGVDAGDLVRFAITVENTGHADAFEVQLADTLPAGFVIPSGGLNLCANNGHGDAIATFDMGGGLFGSGLMLVDGSNGSIVRGVAGSTPNATGTNIAVITYTLQVADTMAPDTTVTNTASLLDYTDGFEADGHLGTPLTDDATVHTTLPSAAKTITGTSLATTTLPAVTVGEKVDYRVTVTVPEGKLPGATVTDSLPAGMALVGCDSINALSDGLATTDLTTNLPGGLGDACAAGTDPTVANNGRDVVFSLGDVTNANRDDTKSETLEINYTAVVLNDSANVRGQSMTNGATLNWTDDGIAEVYSDAVVVSEPWLSITKTPSTYTADAGDKVTYTVTVTNSGSNDSDAYNAAWSDTIPAGMAYVDTPASLEYDSGTVPTTLSISGSNITATWDDLPAGASTQFEYAVIVGDDAVPDHVFHNTEDVTWTSLPDDVTTPQSGFNSASTERTGDTGDPGSPTGDVNDYSATVSADVDVPPAAVAKTVISTSMAGTQGYAIGEIVTFRVRLTIPEGKLPAATITDNLPSGMALVDCVSIDAFSGGLATTDLTTSLAGGFGDACHAGTNPAVTSSGQNVVFTLGDITNANRDNGSAETLDVAYRAVVLNEVGGGHDNVRGHDLTNSATLNWTGATSTVTSTAPSVHVVEPIMAVDKTVNKTTGDAGDEFTFQVVVTNPVDGNGSRGFEATWTDTIPVGLTYSGGLATTTCDVAPTTLTAVGNNLTAVWPAFAQGDSCTIVYKATLDANVPAGASYQNSAALTWTSLSGVHNTLPGFSTYNDLSTERTGNTGDPGTTANTYLATDSVTVTVTQLAPVKSVVTTSESGTTGNVNVAIGEIVRYRVSIVIPEGETKNVSITDALSSGLQYLNDGTTKIAFVTNDAGMTSSTLSDADLPQNGNETYAGHPVYVLPSGSISGGTGPAGAFQSGDTPKFDFGDITNSDRDLDQELIVVEFNVLVNNTIANQAGTNLTDQASLWTGVSQTKLIDSNQLTQTVAEPVMSIAKTIQTHPIDAGDAIVYKIVATNSGGAAAPAYDYHVTDTLPVAVSAPSDVSVVCTSGSYSDASAGSVVDVTFTQIDPGQNCAITITTAVVATEPAGETFINPASAVFTSLPGNTGTASGAPGNSTGSTNPGNPGEATGERTGADGVGNLNDYVNSDQVGQTLAVPSVVKYAPSLANAPIGAETTFDIVVTLPEGTTRGLAVTDTLPVGLDPVSYAVVKTGGRLGATFSGTLADPTQSAIPTDSTHRLWTLTFGDTVVPVNGLTGDEQFEIQITARVSNVVANQGGTVMWNSAKVTYTDPNTGNPVDVAAPAQQKVTVYEPDLTLTKTASNTAPSFNASETYTLVISHRNTTYDIAAYDMTLVDTLPVAAGWTYAGSLNTTLCPDADSSSQSGGVITTHFTAFPLADSCTITYKATIGDQPAAHLLDAYVNTAVANWTSLAGDSTYERTGADGTGGLNDYRLTATATVTVTGVDFQVSKTDGTTSATAAAVLKYVITDKNVGNRTATGVVLTETVPVGTTFNLPNSTGTWLAAVSGNCANGAAAGTVCHINVGSLAGLTTGTSYTFAVTVNDPIAAGLTQISNTTTVADDGTHGADATPGDNTFTDIDTIPQADLRLTKSVLPTRPGANQQVVYTVTIYNDGPDDATSVRVTDKVPVGLTYVSSVPGAGNTYVSGTGVWTIAGTFTHGTSKVLTITATATSSADVTNIAEVTHSAVGDPNSTPNNHVTTENDYATALTHPLIADMAVTKTVSDSHPNVGTNVTFTITATNNGPDDAPNAKVVDVLPAGMTYVSSNPSVGSWAGNTWTIGTLNNGASATLTLTASVDTAGSKTNTAVVSADPFDLVPGNNSASVSISQLLDLAVSKLVDNSVPNVGTNVTFTIGVSNTGTNAANGVVIHDALPAGLTWVSDDSAGAYNHTTGDWTIGTMAANSSATFHVVATVSTVGAKTNTASVGHVNETQTSTANDSATATVTPPQADLAVTKVVDNGSPEIGSNVKWTVTVHNNGGSAATNVTLSDVLQAGLTWVSDDSSGAYDHGTGVWTVGSLANGGTATLNINATVTSGGIKTNTASVGHSDQYDPVSGNNSATATLTTKQADIGVAKTVDNATPNVGGTIHYSLTVTNHGPDTATSLVVTDQLPAGVSYVSSTPSQGSYVSGTGAWSIGTLANNASATMQITATVTASGHIDNTVTFTSMLQTDSNGANNSATVSINIPLAVDIAVTKTVDNNRPNVGSNATFTITATNNGPDNATGVTLSDVLPAGLNPVSATPAPGTTYAGGTWTIGNLSNGASKTLTLVATVTAAGSITNTASLSHSDQFDTNAGNNSASASVDQRINLVVSKSASPLTPNVGTNTTFTIGVSNAGPNTAHNVVINDLLPAGLTYVSDTGSGAYDHTSGAWTVGSIASGGSASLDIVATVTVPGATRNTASVGSVDETQTSLLDDSASATVTPPQADLNVTKTVDNAKPEINGTVIFTVTVENLGPSDATNVVLHDALPANLTYVSDDGGGSYDHGGTNDWTVGGLDFGDTATLHITATVAAYGDYTNTAAVTHSDQFDPVAANNSDDAFLTTRTSDIGVTKTVNHATPNVGDTIEFTVTTKNNGADPATQVVVNDALPAGLTFVSADQVGYNSTTGDWAVGSLAVDATATLHIDARVTASGHIDNTAFVKSLLQKDGNPDNDSATAGLDVPQAADLSLTKTVDDNTPDKGSNVVFTVTLTNGGPDNDTGVVVHDALPAGLTYVSDDAGGAYDSATGDWTVGSIHNGAHTSLQITASVDVESQLTNTAEVTAAALYDPDSTPGNGDPGEDDQAVATINAHGVADLSMAKTAHPAAVTKGGQTTYTIVLTNNGPDDATHVIVRDQLPAGLTYVSDSGNYDKTTGAWTVGSLSHGDSVTLTIVVKVTQTGSITNRVSVVSSDQRDPNPANDAATAGVSAAGATPPVTTSSNAPAPPGQESGPLALWLLALAFGAVALTASGALSIRNRRLKLRR